MLCLGKVCVVCGVWYMMCVVCYVVWFGFRVRLAVVVSRLSCCSFTWIPFPTLATIREICPLPAEKLQMGIPPCYCVAGR